MSVRRELGAAPPTRQGRRPSRLDAVLAAGVAARPRLRLRTRPGGCAATGEFYAVPPDEARELRALQVVDPISYEPIPAGAARDDDDATFRLPFPESAPKNADGSYQYRLYDAAGLWNWVRAPGRAYDPLDRTPLLRSDWEALRDRYSSAAAHPTPALSAFRRPITSGLWPPGVPYVPPPPPPLTDATIRDAVRDALAAGGPEYAHPGHGPIAGWDVRNVTDMTACLGRRGLQRRPERLGRAQRHGHERHVLERRGLQRRPERLGRAQRHGHERHVLRTPRPSTAT